MSYWLLSCGREVTLSVFFGIEEDTRIVGSGAS
jgi:hypothetical protein